MSNTKPIFVLALTYFFYYGLLGVVVPYLGIFLDGRGFSSVQIGELIAIITLARIFGPGFWAGIADRTGNTVGVLRLGSFLTAISFLSVFLFNGFWGLTLAFSLMMMFWTSVLPQLEVITMQSLVSSKVSYGQVRLWGSVGFICLTVLVGKALDIYSTEMPVYVSVFVLILLALTSLFIQAPNVKRNRETQETGSIWRFAKTRPFVIFIFASVCLQISFGAFNSFFSLYLRDLGYSGQQTGLFIALGVLAEVGIFLIAQRLIQVIGIWHLMIGCLALTSLRWYLMAAFADHTWVIVASQMIHALSFGLAHAVSIFFIHHYLPGEYHSRGQAVYLSVAFGLGGAVGTYVAGQQWMQGTNAYLTFATAAAFSLLGAVSMLFCKRSAFEAKCSQT